MPPYEATLTKNLRDAGAIIIAKTGMTELANWVAGAPTPMPGNYNAVGGQGYNPYDPRKDPREATFDGRPALKTGGSSSGVGTAANFWAGNVGSETSGSILSPSNQNMLAGDQADRRPHQPLRRDSDHRRSGHRRADGEERHRRRDHVRRDGERVARSERSGDAAVHAAAGARLHEVPEARRPEGRAHRHPARVLLRSRSRRRPARHAGGAVARRRRRRAERRAEEGDGRRDRRAQSSRARSSSIRPTSRASSTRIRRTTSSRWGQCSGANNAQGQGRGLLGRAEVRHEARLQQVARSRSARPRR